MPSAMNVFLDALNGLPTDYTPIWLMRQAGRYQPEYREIRSRVSFVELCKTPELAAEVTVNAVKDIGADAGIIFADILLILEPLGIGFEFTKGDGPSIPTPVRTAAQIDAVADEIDAAASLHFVMEAIRRTRAEMETPLIGFAGSPFTLASYAIEGGGSKNYYEAKKMMSGDPGAFAALMDKFARAVAGYLNAQIDAGAQAVQLFDSWVGCLSPSDYRTHVMPAMKTLFAALGNRVPVIHFGTGNPELYPLMKEAGGDVIGVDWRIDLSQAYRRLGDDTRLMGNLDPAYLLGPREAMFAQADRILDEAAGHAGHIFNLGHGVMPEAKVATARALVDHVHEASARRR